tara:strand:+ start:2530 stop:4242 length:1713 start_codon:yes stop_codon:yes gene_type:complete
MINWDIKSSDISLVRKLQREFNTSEIIASVMANRNIQSLNDSKSFFSPDLRQLHDPELMLNMDLASSTVADYIESNKKIVVFGDYDVDGITGSSMLSLFLAEAGANPEIYIPDREKEGYGLSKNGIDYAKNYGADLIITCDCGINAFEQVEYANELGINIIITDHHTPDKKLPDALAILNPKQVGCQYPFKGLCGGGVAFKLAASVAEKLNLDPEIVHKHLDLITLGTAADIVPLIDENRTLVYYGLERMSNSDKPGIKALLDISGLSEKELTVGRLVFQLAPRINAAGRMGDANNAAKLLTTNSSQEAIELVNFIDQENIIRQSIQANMVNEAILKVNAEVDLDTEHAIVLWEENWHAGVIGIVASRIKDEYSRPVVVISMKGDEGKGSARSIKGFDLYEHLSNCSEYLDGFGGHPMAAGLTISATYLEKFKSAFIESANECLSKEMLVKSLDIEGEMTLNSIDPRFMNFLKKLGPFGPGNMRPQFASRDITVSGTPKIVGNGNHLKFSARQNGVVYDAIGFNLSDHYEDLINGEPVDIAYVVEENEWQGVSRIQLNLRDIKQKRESNS